MKISNLENIKFGRCQCGTIHLSIESLTLKFSAEAFEQLTVAMKCYTDYLKKEGVVDLKGNRLKLLKEVGP